MSKNKLKLKALRVGNHIGIDLKNYPNNIFTVMEIGETMKCFNEGSNGYWDIAEFEGIILTKDVLVSCGFINQNNGWTIGKRNMADDSAFGLFDYNYCKGKLKLRLNGAYLPLPEVKYLHCLENIYFDLTGKELIYSPIK